MECIPNETLSLYIFCIYLYHVCCTTPTSHPQGKEIRRLVRLGKSAWQSATCRADEQDGTITDKDSNDYMTDNVGM